MSDTVVMVLTAVLFVGNLGWTLWVLWCITRRSPRRQQALTYVLSSIAGTVLLGVVLPAALMGALDPFPVWAVFAGLSATSATVLAWRWPTLPAARWRRPGLVISSCVLLAVLATAGVAVT